MGEGVHEIAVGVLFQTFQGHGTAGRLPYQALQLVTPVGWDVGVGVQRKPLEAGTVGTCQRGPLVRAAKARADAPYPLARPLPKSNALLYRGRQGTSEFGFVIHQGVIAGRHRSVATHFEVSQRAELTDDAMADFLNHVCHVGIAGRLDREKAGLEARFGAIEVDALHEDAMEMEIQIDSTAKTLDKCDRSRLDVGPLETACDRLVHVILTDRGADDRMDLGREVL